LTLPFAFLSGLAVIFGCRELRPSVPGSRSTDALLLTGLALLVPIALAALAHRLARHQVANGRPGRVPARAILRSSALATPLAMLGIHLGLDYGDVVDHLAWHSNVGRMLLGVLPLYAVELPRQVWAVAAQVLIEVAADNRGQPQAWSVPLRDFWPQVRLRFGWPLLLLLPLAMLGLALDALAMDRRVEAFVLGTSLGTTLGTIGFLITIFVVFPAWFRIAFGTDARLPEPLGSRLRDTAARLGFRRSRVLLLPTGMRTMNAMMVGPLPFGRCLCLTDGLLSALDADALDGVVAHEVGHARMGHPGLLIALVMVVPLLLLVPLRFADLGEVDYVQQAVFAVLVVATMLAVMRGLAHRFEHEADIASVRALGAGPCARALATVSRLALPITRGRLGHLWTLHPDERTRTVVMLSYQEDAHYRATFDAGSRRLRHGILGAVLVAAATALVSWWIDWPYERVLWHFNVGDHVAARRELAQLGEPPSRWSRTWRELHEELAAAAQIVPDATDWASAAPRLAAAAWPQAIEQLREHGPAAARPWTSLTVGMQERPTDLQRAIAAYCEAAVAEDPAEMHRIRAVLRRTELPPELEVALREP